MARVVHPIEKQSYEILRARADTSALPPWTRAVVERVIHASADLSYLGDLVCAEADLAAAAQALRDGAPVVADSAMTAAGITAREVVCRIDDRRAAALTRVLGITRAAAGVRVAGSEVGPGAVWVIGTAPTALADLLVRGPAPALVIGLPVGFVGAVEAKQALRASGLPAVTNKGEKGGAAVAAAALNALLYGDPLDDGASPDPAAPPEEPAPQAPGRAPPQLRCGAPAPRPVLARGDDPPEPPVPPAPLSGVPPARPSAPLAGAPPARATSGAPPARRPAREADNK